MAPQQHPFHHLKSLQKMNPILLLLILLVSFTSSLPAAVRDEKHGGPLLNALHATTEGSDKLPFIRSAPSYIGRSLSYSSTACAMSRVLPVFCGQPPTVERKIDGMSDTGLACGFSPGSWLCSATIQSILIPSSLLMFTPLLALALYEWRKIRVYIPIMGSKGW